MPKVEAPQFPSLKVFLPDFGAVGNGVDFVLMLLQRLLKHYRLVEVGT